MFYAFSFALLTLALKTLELSFTYAVWSGFGTALIATIGFIYFREPVTLLKIASILLIVMGVVGLNLGGAKN